MKKPLLHITPPKNWMNDPNGFIYYKGKYHLFYQHFPYRAVWGTMHWGHLVGENLADMEDVGISLYPSNQYDANGCFSGSAIEIDGKMAIYYTSVVYEKENPENIHIARDKIIQSQSMITSDDGFDFNQFDKKLIIPAFCDSEIGDRYDTRDPKVLKIGDRYYMVLGTKHSGHGRILVYSSADGYSWNYLAKNDDERLGSMLECPDLYSVNGQWIMTLSPENTLQDGENYPSHCQYALVDFETDSGKIELLSDPEYIDYGLDYYAAQTAEDKDGNRVIIGWMRMPEAIDGWSGIFTFPRIIDYKEGHIFYRLHPDISAKFVCECDVPDFNSACHIKAVLSEGGKIDIGGYVIKLENGQVKADRSEVFTKARTLFGHKASVGKKFATPKLNGDVTLDIYVDRNIIEIYVNGGYYVLSNVVYSLNDTFCSENAVILKIEKAR